MVVTSKLGLQSSYLTAFRSDGGQNRTFTHPDATQNQISLNPDESSLTSYATGMQVTQKLAGDPRFGMQAPYVKEQRITTPGGRDALLTQNSEATLAQRGDLLSVQALNRTLTLNGKTTAVNYDAASLTWRSTSPQARQTAVIIDPYGRPLEQQVTDVLPVTVRYDSRGRLDRAAQGARQATLAYDPAQRLSCQPHGRARQHRLVHARRSRPAARPARCLAASPGATGGMRAAT